MKRFWLRAALALAIVVSVPSAARAATPEEIDLAIANGKKFLYSRIHGDNWEGTFGIDPTNPSNQIVQGGETALTVWALLTCGEKRTDPLLAGAIDFALKASSPGPYAVGFRCQLWLALPPQDRIKAALRRDRELLLKNYKRSGVPAGHFGYFLPPNQQYDHSVSQIGLLGLWACQEAGLEIPIDFWQRADKGWRDHQNADGSWAYLYEKSGAGGGPGNTFQPSLQMTAAGVASLYLADDELTSDGPARVKAIDQGIKWIEQHFDEFKRTNYPMDYMNTYPLWGIERVGLASGLKYIGTIDWYERGADYLIGVQNKQTGAWSQGRYDTFSTCLALLFLERGRKPLVINKLQYSISDKGKETPAKWNGRPRDIANITRWIGQEAEKEFRWQIIPLDRPVAEWHEAPILYLSGDQEPTFTPAQEAKIKQFVEEGGLIVGNPDLGNKRFGTGLKALGSRLFKTYEWRVLPDDHAIFAALYPASKWKSKVSLVSLGNGSREYMILLPESDPAKTWQSRNFKIKPELSEVMANILAYAADRDSLLTRGKSWIRKLDGNAFPSRSIKVARLEYPGNWDPEPFGWKQFGIYLQNRDKVGLDVQKIKLGDGKLKDFKVAHMTGTTDFSLKPSEKEEIKKFVEGGGTLIVDAAGGSGPFATSVKKELATIFPTAGPSIDLPLKPDSSLYAAGGSKLERFDYRPWARKKIGDAGKPRLSAISVGNRLAVIISTEDLSTGLVNRPVDGVIGYTSETANELMRKCVLYAVPK